MTSSNRSARSSSASTCRPTCRPTARCEQPISRLLERRVQILDQVVVVFEPGREADQAFAYPEFGARLHRQPLMRGGGGMGDEAFGVAEVVGNQRKLQRVEKTERRRLAALDLKGDKGRSGAHLLLRQRGLRVIGAGWINQP